MPRARSSSAVFWIGVVRRVTRRLYTTIIPGCRHRFGLAKCSERILPSHTHRILSANRRPTRFVLEWAASGAVASVGRCPRGASPDRNRNQQRASETAVSEQHEEESLRRAAREQAEIERQTDALVLRTLTAMVTAAEDLKSKLRRDSEDILENYRRTKRGLENEISLAGAERQRLRREAEDERDVLLERARETADQIVADAESERESLLAEVRTMEHRLRGLESQIRAALGLGTEEAPRAAAAAPAPAPAAPEPEPAFVSTLR